MKDYEDMEYFTPSEEIVDILCQKTQNTNRLFFRVLVAYYFAKVASMMRAVVSTHDRGNLPVNLYAINLALSGQGKGHSTNILEEDIINDFRERFIEQTMPAIAEDNLHEIAATRAARKNSSHSDEIDRVKKEYDALGELPFSFDSGTTPAIKQMRHKLLMANAGSMNLEMDEIGSNLSGNMEAMATYLELYDVGKTKQKLTKNTSENTRNAEIEGRTPANMMLFGTPSKLLDGGKTEEEFMSLLETGYARRCLFGYQTSSAKMKDKTVEDIYDMLTDNSVSNYIQDLSDKLYDLADKTHFNKELMMSKDVSLLVIEYRLKCEERSERLPDHQEIQRAELCHRYFKALKLAGAYAFVDGVDDITEEHLYSAIKLVEDSGQAFLDMLNRDRPYVKLAKYISTIDSEITHADLVEDLPCYKGSESHRKELLTLATAWGYKNNIIIKRSIMDGIEFLKGESLKEVDMKRIRISHSKDKAKGYLPEEAPWDKFHILTQAKDLQWSNHHFLEQHRKEDNVIPGFDVVVIDVDDSVSISMVELLLKDYTYHIHTTKRHRAPLPDGKGHYGDRFRLIMPLNYHVKLDKPDFTEFMRNVFAWLPFKVDEATIDRSRMWSSHPGQVFTNEGERLDALMFIPKTRKAEEAQKRIVDLSNLSNLERWFIDNTMEGNRSSNLVRYALMLVDSGLEIEDIQHRVMALNEKLPDKLEETEILTTIMQTANKAYIQKSKSTP